MVGEIALGLVIGLLIGAAGLWWIDRRQQAIVKKLVDSRRKLERQRTQAVNDYFALRAEVEESGFDAPAAAPPSLISDSSEDPEVVAELSKLRSLIARADGALTAARRKRDANEAEISRLSKIIEDSEGNADVIDLHRASDTTAEGMAL